MGRPTKYPEQFRSGAIEIVETLGRPAAEVARSLGISEGTLWNWVLGPVMLPRLRPILTGIATSYFDRETMR